MGWSLHREGLLPIELHPQVFVLGPKVFWGLATNCILKVTTLTGQSEGNCIHVYCLDLGILLNLISSDLPGPSITKRYVPTGQNTQKPPKGEKKKNMKDAFGSTQDLRGFNTFNFSLLLIDQFNLMGKTATLSHPITPKGMNRHISLIIPSYVHNCECQCLRFQTILDDRKIKEQEKLQVVRRSWRKFEKGV